MNRSNSLGALKAVWAGILAVAVFMVPAAKASLIQISTLTEALPTGGTYETATTEIGITGSDLTVLNSLSDSSLTVLFSNPMIKESVPATYATWGSPPETETSTPNILNTFGNPDEDSRILTFSSPLSVFGLEAETGDFANWTFTMTFYAGAVDLGSITRAITGGGGARILAGYSTLPFTSVMISDNAPGTVDNSFATADYRYELAAAIPEPGTLRLLIGAIGLLGLWCWRARDSVREDTGHE